MRVHHGDLPCAYCGSTHAGVCAYQYREDGGAPVEHPSANGIYTGPAKVRRIPMGVSGADLGVYGHHDQSRMDEARQRGGIRRAQQRRSA
jgi:hypothetical protein